MTQKIFGDTDPKNYPKLELAKDVLFIIYKMLPLRERLMVRSVSRGWNQILNDDRCWPNENFVNRTKELTDELLFCVLEGVCTLPQAEAVLKIISLFRKDKYSTYSCCYESYSLHELIALSVSSEEIPFIPEADEVLKLIRLLSKSVYFRFFVVSLFLNGEPEQLMRLPNELQERIKGVSNKIDELIVDSGNLGVAETLSMFNETLNPVLPKIEDYTKNEELDLQSVLLELIISDNHEGWQEYQNLDNRQLELLQSFFSRMKVFEKCNSVFYHIALCLGLITFEQAVEMLSTNLEILFCKKGMKLLSSGRITLEENSELSWDQSNNLFPEEGMKLLRMGYITSEQLSGMSDYELQILFTNGLTALRKKSITPEKFHEIFQEIKNLPRPITQEIYIDALELMHKLGCKFNSTQAVLFQKKMGVFLKDMQPIEKYQAESENDSSSIYSCSADSFESAEESSEDSVKQDNKPVETVLNIESYANYKTPSGYSASYIAITKFSKSEISDSSDTSDCSSSEIGNNSG